MRLIQTVQPGQSKTSQRRVAGKVSADGIFSSKTLVQTTENQPSHDSRRGVQPDCRSTIELRQLNFWPDRELASRESRITRKQKPTRVLAASGPLEQRI